MRKLWNQVFFRKILVKTGRCAQAVYEEPSPPTRAVHTGAKLWSLVLALGMGRLVYVRMLKAEDEEARRPVSG